MVVFLRVVAASDGRGGGRGVRACGGGERGVPRAECAAGPADRAVSGADAGRG